MLKVFYRNYFIFSAILILCALGLGFLLISGERKVARSDQWVAHSHKVILESEKLHALIEGMLAAQRGYLLSGNIEFMKKYELRKKEVSAHIANLTAMTSNNPSQLSRLEEIRQYFVSFSEKLEQRASERSAEAIQKILSNVESIDNLKNNITRVNNDFLEESYALLNARIKIVENRRNQYYMTLLIGGMVSVSLLLIFNGYLLRAQSKRAEAERNLKDREERFALAIEGANDGIFDWNVKKDEIFYSRQFFGMLGSEQKAFTGSTVLFWEKIHPEDVERVREYLKSYLRGEISEYSQTFRMQHKDGRWLWVNSRAKAIFDAAGQAVRMVGSNTDISNMKEYELKLEEAKVKAEEASQAKSDFLAHMSHEIRTPLTTISGVAEIFSQNQKELPPQKQELIKVLHSSAISLKDLISDILDFSKIESGEFQLEEAAFELNEAFENVISIMKPKAKDKKLDFKFEYDAIKDITLYGASLRLRQILINLIGNAIKFTEKGHVHVYAYKSQRDGLPVLQVDVEDTGIGIPVEKQGLIFERFKQADDSVSRKYGGTGLGLTISRNLADLMGGEIQLRSAPGEGAVFSLILPFILAEESELIEEERSHNKLSVAAIEKKLQAIFKEQDRKILMVEDYEGSILVIGHILQELGCDYDVARTGLEGINMWRENSYDLILMDVQMPEMDGFTATTQIRHMEQEKNAVRTPIIGMTAHALVKDRDKCIEVGMDAYLPKPIVESDFKKHLLKYLVKSQKKAA